MKLWTLPAVLLMLLASFVCVDAGGRPARSGAVEGDRVQPARSGNEQLVVVASLGKGLVPSADEKKRTPKSAPEKKKKDESKPSSDEDEDSDCAGSIGEAMFAGMCGGDDDEEMEIAPMVPAPVVPVTPAPVEFMPFRGVVSPPDPTVREVEAWAVAGGAGMQGRVVFALPRATEIEATQRQVVDGVGWLWVHWPEAPPEAEAAYGWVLEYYVQRIGGETMPTMGELEAPLAAPMPSAWQLNTDLAVAFLTNDRIEIEYDKVGYHVGLCAMGAIAPWFYIGGRVDWTHSVGDPKYIYTTTYDPPGSLDSLMDNPLESRVDIIAITIPMGHSVLTSGKAHFSWSLGPGVYVVRESADIEFTEMNEQRGQDRDAHRRGDQDAIRWGDTPVPRRLYCWRGDDGFEFRYLRDIVESEEG